MSLAKYNTKAAQDAGTAHHVFYSRLETDDDGTLKMVNGKPVEIRDLLYNRFNPADPAKEFPETDKSKPVELILRGPDSDEVAKAYRASFDLERRVAFEERPETTEESLENNIRRWKAAVAAEAVFRNPVLSWIGAQIDEKLGDRARFLPPAATGSASTPKPSSGGRDHAARHRSPKS
jgi:hypothetical protein